jgi:hypothetical protein
VSLQALMPLLGHGSAELSLRYGKLFDSTVRAEYERALTLAKQRLGTMPAGRTSLPLANVTDGMEWKDSPAIKSRLPGGFCLRAPAQGACAYDIICEHCPNFRTDTGYLPVLAAQKADAEQFAADADVRVRGAGSAKPSATVSSSPARTTSSPGNMADEQSRTHHPGRVGMR